MASETVLWEAASEAALRMTTASEAVLRAVAVMAAAAAVMVMEAEVTAEVVMTAVMVVTCGGQLAKQPSGEKQPYGKQDFLARGTARTQPTRKT
jgi:hypothetical protein